MTRPRKIRSSVDLLDFLTRHGMGEPVAASYRGVEFVLTSTGTQKAIVCEDIVGSLYFNTTLTSMLQAIRDLDQLADMLEDL